MRTPVSSRWEYRRFLSAGLQAVDLVPCDDGSLSVAIEGLAFEAPPAGDYLAVVGEVECGPSVSPRLLVRGSTAVDIADGDHAVGLRETFLRLKHHRVVRHVVLLGHALGRDPPRLLSDLLARIRQKRDGAGFLIDVWVYHFLGVLSTFFSHSLSKISQKNTPRRRRFFGVQCVPAWSRTTI